MKAPDGVPFLTAEWRDLIMMTWAVDPGVLGGHLPAKTELDFFEGRCFVSLVAFQYAGTRVKGYPIPGHIDFNEINLRFYVRRALPAGSRHGVVFFREIVPRMAIAFIARALYGEPYVAMETVGDVKILPEGKSVSYSWGNGGAEHSVSLQCGADSYIPADDSLEGYIVNQDWGYVPRRASFTSEYRLMHTPWALRAAKTFDCKVDFERLYGAELGRALSGPPELVFLSDGSPVGIYPGDQLKQDQIGRASCRERV